MHNVQGTVPADPKSVALPLGGLPLGSKLVHFQHIQQKGCPDA